MPASVIVDMNHPSNGGSVIDSWSGVDNVRALEMALSKLQVNAVPNAYMFCGSQLATPIVESLKNRKSQNMTERVIVPTSEHVAEIVGRQGCKIKALRTKTNTYIKTPVRGEDPVFVITGRRQDVELAKQEIVEAAEHFSQIRASRKREAQQQGPAQPAVVLAQPGQVTVQVKVPYRVVGLVVGPKGATIKRIQQQTNTYIVTPSRDKDPVFEVTGLPDCVDRARLEIEAHIAARTGGIPDDSDIANLNIDMWTGPPDEQAAGDSAPIGSHNRFSPDTASNQYRPTGFVGGSRDTFPLSASASASSGNASPASMTFNPTVGTGVPRTLGDRSGSLDSGHPASVGTCWPASQSSSTCAVDSLDYPSTFADANDPYSRVQRRSGSLGNAQMPHQTFLGGVPAPKHCPVRRFPSEPLQPALAQSILPPTGPGFATTAGYFPSAFSAYPPFSLVNNIAQSQLHTTRTSVDGDAEQPALQQQLIAASAVVSNPATVASQISSIGAPAAFGFVNGSYSAATSVGGRAVSSGVSSLGSASPGFEEDCGAKSGLASVGGRFCGGCGASDAECDMLALGCGHQVCYVCSTTGGGCLCGAADAPAKFAP